MAIVRIHDRRSNCYGWQARAGGKTCYFAESKYGAAEAERLARLAEVGLVEQTQCGFVSEPGVSYRGAARRGKPNIGYKRLVDTPTGVGFEWRCRRGTNWWPYVTFHNSTSLRRRSVVKHGIVDVARQAVRFKMENGYPIASVYTMARKIAAWIADTYGKYGKTITDFPDITTRGLLKVDMQTVRILAISENVPAALELHDGKVKLDVQWVHMSGSDRNKFMAAMKSDTTSATRKQRQAAADDFALIAARYDIDGVFITVTSNLLSFVKSALRHQDVSAYVSQRQHENIVLVPA